MVVNIDKFIDETEAASLSGGFAVAPISKSPVVVLPISGTTAPSLGTISGSEIETQDHPDGSTTGAKFEFQVPDDYDEGSLTLTLVYAMSTAVASPNNICILEVGAEIAQASTGSVDTATYPPGSVGLTTPDNTTDITRSVTLLTIDPADFAPGDKVLFIVRRLGGDGGDLHTGVLQIIDYMVTYQGQVASRRLIEDIEVFTDTDEPPPPAGTISNFDTLDFQTGVDQEQRFQFTIPDQWDGLSDFHVQFTYAMSTSSASVVVLESEGEIADATGGSVTSFPVQVFNLSTTADTDVHRTVVIRAIEGMSRNAGDVIGFKIARRGADVADTHGGDWQLISATVAIGVGPSSAVSELTQFYLSDGYVRQVAGTTSSNSEAPVFGGDFELYTVLSATAASSQINLEWMGRLASVQSTLVDFRVAVRGSAGSQYQLLVYEEGSAGTPVYDSGLTVAPTSRSELVVPGGSITPQPSGDKRYFIVVEAHLDAGEELRVGRPFVRQG